MKRLLILFLLAQAGPLDTGWWARAHWTAAALDYSSTGLCVEQNACDEGNPAARVFISRHPQPSRLAIAWAAESITVSSIPNKKLRRVVQIIATSGHVFFGTWNLTRYH